MKKILQLLVLSFSCITTFAQIKVNDKKEVIDAFKNTETVFILSNVFDSNAYDKILKDSWTVTTYKIVNINEFNLEDYLDGKHSFVYIDHNRYVSTRNVLVISSLEFFMFDTEAKKKEIEKLKKKSPKKQKDYIIMNEERINIASIELFYNDNEDDYPVQSKNIPISWTYNNDLFENYKLGFLKNYFQEVSSFISENKGRGMYGGECTPEIKNIKNHTLYISDFALGTPDPTKSTKDQSKEKIEKQKIEVFREYKYKYELTNNEAINTKILNGDEFYYMRFFTIGYQKFIEIINSKTGNIIYKTYKPGVGFDLESKHLKEIANTALTGKI